MGIAASLLLPAWLWCAAPPAPAAAPAPCSLEDGATEIASAVRRRATAGRGGEKKLWERHPWQDACAPVAARWLVGDDDARRLAAAAWFWANRTEQTETPIYIPIVTEFFNFRSIRGQSERRLPFDPAALDAVVARAAKETEPLVLRVQLEQLVERDDLLRARAAIRAGLALVARDPDSLGYAFALWNSRRAEALTRPERDLLWSLRSGEHAALARSVLAIHRDPEFVAWLKAHLGADTYEHASLAGLSPLFSKKVIDEARARVTRKESCHAMMDLPRRLRGAKASEILGLAEVLLGCPDKLSTTWEPLLTSAAWSTEASAALIGLVRLQAQKGEPEFWRYGDTAIRRAASLGTDDAVEPMLEALRAATRPQPGEARSAWRFADDVIRQLRVLGTPAAAEAIVEVARIAAGPCESSGRDCLWRVRDRAIAALEEIGGPELARRRAAVAAIQPQPGLVVTEE